MKRYHSLVYFVILVLLGGYFYYFEVLKKEQREVAEKEAKKVFAFKTDQVGRVQIFAGDNETIRLTRETDWRIEKPVGSDTDEGAMMNLLDTLETLERERQVAEAPEDLKPYGLEKPALKIRFQVGEQWKELLVGDKNPSGESYYAKTGDQADVFLVEAGSRDVLNKGFDELRRHELFTFLPEDVTGILMKRSDNATIHIEYSQEGDTWKSPGDPEVNIRKSKVKNILDQLHWLRAEKFLENDVRNLTLHGLDSPEITIELQFREGRQATLRLGKNVENQDYVTAVSSELPAIVQVNVDILEELPKTLHDLEDRSLLAFDTESVSQVKWRMGEVQGHVIRMNADKWGKKSDQAKPEELKESWRVGSLFWELQDAEYEQEVKPAPNMPSQPHVRLELWDDQKKLETLVWDRSEKEPSAGTLVWIEREEKIQAVRIKTETIDKIEEKLGGILQDEQKR